MNPFEILLINVGSNGNEKNGIAPVYSNGHFEYWPIEENYPGRHTLRFRDLNIECKYPDLYAHHDPCFKPTPTYGDVRDVPAFRSLDQSLKLGKKPLLLFAATLKYRGEAAVRPSWILDRTGYYIIGYFLIKEVRFMAPDGTMNWKGHKQNAHYLRHDYNKRIIKVLVAGGRAQNGVTQNGVRSLLLTIDTLLRR